MFKFEDDFKRIPGQSVLCVGDLMLDEFVYGDVGRISPEAPAPVLAVTKNEVLVGGAGNVARNIAGLGASCAFVGLVGKDAAADALAGKLAGEPLIEHQLITDASRPTTRKVRFVSEQHSTHLLRADWEEANWITGETEQQVLDAALKMMPRAGSIVLSDYGKGVLTPRIVARLIAAAKEGDKPVIVDPKRKDYSIYKGATLITPNWHELAEATLHPIH